MIMWAPFIFSQLLVIAGGFAKAISVFLTRPYVTTQEKNSAHMYSTYVLTGYTLVIAPIVSLLAAIEAISVVPKTTRVTATFVAIFLIFYIVVLIWFWKKTPYEVFNRRIIRFKISFLQTLLIQVCFWCQWWATYLDSVADLALTMSAVYRLYS